MTERVQDTQQSWFQRLCCCCSCCPVLYCCGYACCCCHNNEVEEKPLLNTNPNGVTSYSLPKGQELQSMDFHLPGNQSVTESSPWNSERQSLASDAPNLDDVEPAEHAAITDEPHSLHSERRLSWKLQSGTTSPEQASFTIQIRKQTADQ